MADALLELRQVTASYGKIQALGGISMAVPEKAIIALHKGLVEDRAALATPDHLRQVA